MTCSSSWMMRSGGRGSLGSPPQKKKPAVSPLHDMAANLSAALSVSMIGSPDTEPISG